MSKAAHRLVSETWASAHVRDIYADFNDLTLDIVTEVRFGRDIPRHQATVTTSALA